MNIKDSTIVKWAKRHKALTGMILVLLMLYIVYQNWFYWGTVVDAETGKPIEGAVVVAKWDWVMASVAGPSDSLKDVKETLTDKDGRWVMRGQRPLLDDILPYLVFIPYTTQPRFIVYKPGYCPIPAGFGIEACKDKMRKSFTGIGGGQVVELPKLTTREDRLSAQGIGPIHASSDSRETEILEKQKEFIKLLNGERRALGLKAIDYLGEE